MLDTFKVRLKAKAKTLGANLSQKRIDEYSARLHKKNPDITEEKDHDEKIDDFLEYVDLKEVAITDDRLRTLDSKNKGQQNNPSEDDEEDDDDEPAPAKPTKKVKKDKDDVPEWAKGLITEIQSLKADRVKTSISEKVRAHDKLKDIPEAQRKILLNGRALPEKEEDIESFVETVESDYLELKQSFVDQGDVSSTPILGSANKEGVSTAVEQYIADKFSTDDKGTAGLGGKKVF